MALSGYYRREKFLIHFGARITRMFRYLTCVHVRSANSIPFERIYIYKYKMYIRYNGSEINKNKKIINNTLTEQTCLQDGAHSQVGDHLVDGDRYYGV